MTEPKRVTDADWLCGEKIAVGGIDEGGTTLASSAS